MAKKLDQREQKQKSQEKVRPLRTVEDLFWHHDGWKLCEAFNVPDVAERDVLLMIAARYYVENRALFDQMLASAPISDEAKEFFAKTMRDTSMNYVARGALKDRRLRGVYSYHNTKRRGKRKRERVLKQLFLSWQYEAERVIDRDHRHTSRKPFKELKKKFDPDADPLAQEIQHLAELHHYDDEYDNPKEFLEDFIDGPTWMERPDETKDQAIARATQEYHDDIKKWWDDIQPRKPNDFYYKDDNDGGLFYDKQRGFGPPEYGYSKPPKTSEEIYHGFQGIAHAIYITNPHSGGDWYHDFDYPGTCDLRHEEAEPILKYYDESLDPDRLRRPGGVHLSEDAQRLQTRILNIRTALSQHFALNVPKDITAATQKDLDQAMQDFKAMISQQETMIVLPIRRNPKLSEEQIAEGCYLNNHFGNPHWFCKSPSQQFYTKYFNRHFIGDETDEPITWATKRAKLMAGYSYNTISMIDSSIIADYPIRALMHQFEAMAPLACNTASPSLINPRSYGMTGKKAELYTRALLVFGKELPVELTCFIFENSRYFEPEFLANPKLKLLPQCLKNGLIIDRMNLLFRAMFMHSSSPQEAFDYTLDIITDIYGGEEEPWWFKEDVDLVKTFNGNTKETSVGNNGLLIAFDNRGKAITRRLAEKSGFAFLYARAAYKRFGYKLAQVEGLNEEDAIDFTCEITKALGVGNVKRVGNIIEYAVHHVNEVSGAEKKDSLQVLMKFIVAHSSDSKIINCMEGGEVGFFVPSFGIMMHAIMGDKRARKELFDEITLNYGHFQEVASYFSRPYEHRAHLYPAVRAYLPSSRMLGASISMEDRHLLPQNTEAMGSIPPSTKTPSNSVLKLFGRVERECGYLSEDVLGPYFAFIAPKLKDPLDPPEGLFRLIKKFREIPNPEEDYFVNERLFAHPFDKGSFSAKVVRAHVDRILVLSNLFDLYAFGILTEAELMDFLRWVADDNKPDAASTEFSEEDSAAVPYFDEEEEGEKNEGDENEVSEAVLVEEDLEDDGLSDRERARRDELKGREKRMNSLKHEAGKDFRYERVGRLEKLTKILVGVRILIVTQFLPTENYKAIIERLFEASKDPKTDLGMFKAVDRNFLETRDYEQMIGALKTVLSYKIIDTEKLKQAFIEAGSLDRIMDLVEGCLRLADLLDSLGATIETAEGNLARIVFARRDYDEMTFIKSVRQELDILENDILKLFGTFDFIKEDFVRSFVERIPKINLWTTILNIMQKTASRANHSSTPMEAVNDLSVSAMKAAHLLIKTAEMGLPLISENKPLPPLLPGHGEDNMLMRVEPAPSTEVAVFGPLDTTGMDVPQMIHAARELLHKIETAEEALLDTLKNQEKNILEQILCSRRRSLGLRPVGGKIHFVRSLPDEKLRIFSAISEVRSTSFQMIHANKAMILPPSPSAGEMLLLLFTLEVTDAIDKDYPELQISIASRLNPDNAAILGSSILLATEKGVDYAPDAFKTSHNFDTGARIMAYDAGASNVELPFMRDFKEDSTKELRLVKGRTDMLGRRAPGDIELYQMLGTVLSHEEFGGPFGKLAVEFKRRHAEIIKKYDLQDVFAEKWVYTQKDNREDDQASEKHYQCVRKVTDAWFDCKRKFKETGIAEGVIFEMRDLFTWLEGEIAKIQEEIALDPDPITCKDVDDVLTISP